MSTTSPEGIHDSQSSKMEKEEQTFDTTNRPPVTLAWNNVNVVQRPKGRGISSCCRKTADVVPKQIIFNACGVATPGTVLALMAASGAGKSTLLNVLTFRTSRRLKVTGKVFTNGKEAGGDEMTAISAYVQQEHVFIGSLTVRETLSFHATLKMDQRLSSSEREARVDEIIQELGLQKCEKTLIGIPGRIKGISGGEMRRLAFACELLTDPLIMFCDEPTSGLDSYMAENVILALQKQAKKGMTIISTIHQPSSEVFALFDRIMLMAEGRVVYLGKATDAVEFFSSLGYPRPHGYNPADHFIHVLAIRPGKEEECRRRVAIVADTFEVSELGKKMKELAAGGGIAKHGPDVETGEMHSAASIDKMTERMKSIGRYKASWFTQFSAVFGRQIRSLRREPILFRIRIMQTLTMSIMMGLVFWRQRIDQKGVQNINGALFQIVLQMTMLNMFPVVHVFCAEMPVYMREHFNGLYRTDAYFLGKTFAESPLFIIFPAIYGAVVYFMIGLNESIMRFLVFLGVIVVNANVACSFGYMISTAAGQINIALAAAPMIFVPLILFGGFFLNNESGLFFLSWMRWLSWFNYSLQLLVVNQWGNIDEIECTPNAQGHCQGFSSGQAVIDYFSFSEDYNLRNIICLFALLFGIRTLALIFLQIRTARHR